MEVNVHLNVKSNEVFDLMLDSLVYDIEQSTNQKVKKEDIKKGYTYEKYLTNKVGKQGHADVTIVELEYPHHYKASFATSRGENTIEYIIREENDGVHVQYIEEYFTSKKSKEINHKLMSIFYNSGQKKRMLKVLLSIETYILDNREKSCL